MISKSNQTGTPQSILPAAASNVLVFNPAVRSRSLSATRTGQRQPAEIVALYDRQSGLLQTPTAAAIADCAELVLTSGADHKPASDAELDPVMRDLLAWRLQDAEMIADKAAKLDGDHGSDEQGDLASVPDRRLHLGLIAFPITIMMFASIRLWTRGAAR